MSYFDEWLAWFPVPLKVNFVAKYWGEGIIQHPTSYMTPKIYKEFLKTNVMPKADVGRPRQRPLSCIICFRQLENDSTLLEHVYLMHIRGKSNFKVRDKLGFYCPVEGCRLRFDHRRRAYNAHFADRNIHDVYELIKAGQAPWMNGRNTMQDRYLILDWLLIHKLVVEIEQSEGDAHETETIDNSVFDFDTPSTRKGNPNEARTEVVDT